MKTVICCVLGTMILVGCGRVVLRTPDSEDNYRLDQCRQQAPELVDSVKKFYRALEAKDWPTSYDMRTSTFKQDVPRNLYLEQMAKENAPLSRYKVLSVHMYGDSAAVSAAEIIMEFDQGASYASTRWKKVNGIWLCEEPGLSGYLTSLRAPDWITH
jgi:hypothetical protein